MASTVSVWVARVTFTSFEFVPLRHLWSLAVEEQFYLIWPVVMLVVVKFGKRRLPIVSTVFVLIAVALAVYMAIVYQPGTIQRLTTHQTIHGVCFVSRFHESTICSRNFYPIERFAVGRRFAFGGDRGLLQIREQVRASYTTSLVLVASCLALMMWRFHTVIEGTDGALLVTLIVSRGFFLTDLASVALIAAAVHPG